MNLAQAIYLDEAGRLAWHVQARAVLSMELERTPVYAIAALACAYPRAAGMTRHYVLPGQRQIRPGTLADRFCQALRRAHRKLNYPDLCARIECKTSRANRAVLTELVRTGKVNAGGERLARVYWHPSVDWK